jgi:hypothetical protein
MWKRENTVLLGIKHRFLSYPASKSSHHNDWAIPALIFMKVELNWCLTASNAICVVKGGHKVLLPLEKMGLCNGECCMVALWKQWRLPRTTYCCLYSWHPWNAPTMSYASWQSITLCSEYEWAQTYLSDKYLILNDCIFIYFNRILPFQPGKDPYRPGNKITTAPPAVNMEVVPGK